jgi:uncharacterized protein YggE
VDRNVTVSTRSLVLAVLALLALVAAYVLGGTGEAGAGQQEPAGRDRTLAMRGVGTVTAVPDQLAFTVAVTVEDDDVAPAMDTASRTTARVLRVLAGHGVARADTQSTGLGISPQYDYRSSTPVLTGYRVNQRMRVTVTDLATSGKAIAAVVEAGGNAVRVSNIALGLQDPDALLGEARDAAVAEATAKARQYADATGQDLGEVVSLKEVTRGGRRDELLHQSGYKSLRAVADAAAVPIRAGEEELAVTVQVVWAFA